MSFERDDDTAGASYAVTTPAVPKVGGGFSALPCTLPGIDTTEGRVLVASRLARPRTHSIRAK